MAAARQSMSMLEALDLELSPHRHRHRQAPLFGAIPAREFQGLKLVHAGGKGSCSTGTSAWATRYPRTFNVTMKMLLPLGCLVVLSYLCGHIIASLESQQEMDSNDVAFATFYKTAIKLHGMHWQLKSGPSSCLDSFIRAKALRNSTRAHGACKDNDAQAALLAATITGADGTHGCQDVFRNGQCSIIPSILEASGASGKAMQHPCPVSCGVCAQQALFANTTTTTTFGPAGNEAGFVNITELKVYTEACGLQHGANAEHSLREISGILSGQFYANDLAFNWVSCGNNTSGSNWDDMAGYSLNQWIHSFNQTVKPDFSNYQNAADKASGMQNCNVNTAGGAVFWFTIMTTLGYGNTAPVTEGGRAMVYTLGFVCILIFTGIIGQAGYICLAVCDDVLHRVKASWLTSGWPAVCIWVSALYLWMLVLSYYFIHYQKERNFTDVSLKDAFWFAYISTTTVGFGDFYIQHPTVRLEDMVYIPMLFLFAFVLLANFLLKFSDVVMESIPEAESLEDILERSRRPKGARTKDDTAGLLDAETGSGSQPPLHFVSARVGGASAKGTSSFTQGVSQLSICETTAFTKPTHGTKAQRVVRLAGKVGTTPKGNKVAPLGPLSLPAAPLGRLNISHTADAHQRHEKVGSSSAVLQLSQTCGMVGCRDQRVGGGDYCAAHTVDTAIITRSQMAEAAAMAGPDMQPTRRMSRKLSAATVAWSKPSRRLLASTVVWCDTSERMPRLSAHHDPASWPESSTV